MKCAECEAAEAELRCVDEDLHFCGDCSARLHAKRARQHHELEPIVARAAAAAAAVVVCDECEEAAAEVECFECGGLAAGMVFCRACSAVLHSRAARARHHVAAIGRLRRQGREKCVSGRVVIDLTDADSGSDGSDETETVVAGRNAPHGLRPSDDHEARAKEEAGRKMSASDGVDTAGKKPSWPRAEAERLRDIKLEERGNVGIPDGKKRGAPESKFLKASAKREPHSEPRAEGSDSSASELNDSEDEERGGVHRIQRGSISLEAFVVDADDDHDEGDALDSVPDGDVKAGIKNRIKNMLELGLHPDTPEFEAQQALKNAQRLLTKHNLQQAEVLNGNLRDTSSLVGGMRIVELRAKGKTKNGRMGLWVKKLGWVIGDNFDCQYFFKAGSNSKPLTVVFYGINHNADCAGYAFAATFNKITKMSAAYVGDEAVDDDKENRDAKLPHVRQGTYTRIARTNYRNGIVAGLKEAVKSAQETRKQSTSRRHEDKQSDCKTCNNHPDEGAGSSDGEENFPLHRNPVDELGHGIDDDSPTIRATERCMAITALVMHSKKVGEDFLKQKGIKIRKSTVKDRSVRNEDAFSRGKKDAARIDINQRSITGANVKKPKGQFHH